MPQTLSSDRFREIEIHSAEFNDLQVKIAWVSCSKWIKGLDRVRSYPTTGVRLILIIYLVWKYVSINFVFIEFKLGIFIELVRVWRWMKALGVRSQKWHTISYRKTNPARV